MDGETFKKNEKYFFCHIGKQLDKKANFFSRNLCRDRLRKKSYNAHTVRYLGGKERPGGGIWPFGGGDWPTIGYKIFEANSSFRLKWRTTERV